MKHRRLLQPPGYRIALTACLAFLIWTNVETPMWADDYCRALEPGVSSALASAWHDYFNWTGRFFLIVINCVVMSTGLRGSMLPFDILNALIFVGLIVVVIRIATLASGRNPAAPRDRAVRFADVMFAALLLWWGPRAVGEVALWKTGSIGYLWPVAGELLILERVAAFTLWRRAPPPLWLAAPFAFVIATFLEPLSVLVSATLCLCVARAWRRRQPRGWLLALTVSHVAGSVFLLAAPGNFARAATVAAVAPSSALDRFAGVYGAIGKLADGYMLVALALVVLPFVVRENQLRGAAGRLFPAAVVAEEPGRRRRIAPPAGAGRGWVFLILAFAYMLTLLAVPRSLIEARVVYPGSVFLICYVVSLFQFRPLTPAHNAAMAAILTLLSVLTAAVVVRDLRQIAAVDRAWSRTLAGARPGSNIVLPMIYGRHGGTIMVSKHRFFEGFTRDANYFVNQCYAHAWGMASISGN